MGTRWRWAFFLLNTVGVLALLGLLWTLHAPPGEMLIVRVNPQGVVEPSAAGSVEVAFGALLDTETVKPDALRLSPMVAGEATCVDGRVLRYKLHEPLARATRYRIVLSPALRGRAGERVQDRVLEFETPALAVKHIAQARVDKAGAVTFAIEFNALVNPEELRDGLLLTDVAGSVSFVPVGGPPASRVLVHVPQVNHDTLQLTLKEGLAGIEGPLGLKEPYQAELRILTAQGKRDSSAETAKAGKPVVTITPELRFLGMRAQNTYGENRIRIEMNQPLDASAAGEYVSIAPDVPHQFVAWHGGLYINGEFQAGQRYRVTLKKGLPAGDAGILHRDIVRAVWFADKGPQMRFAFGSGVLTPQGLLTVPVQTVNMKSAGLMVQQLYPSNIVEHVLTGEWTVSTGHAKTMKEKTLRFSEAPNKEVETLLDLRELVGSAPRGVYGLMLRNPERYWSRDSAVIVVSDIGLSVRLSNTQALFWVTSLSSAKPRAGVEVQVYTNRRQFAGKAVTDADGLATISLPSFVDGEEPALCVATQGEDMNYLAFDRNARSRGRDAAKGRAFLTRGYEAFVTPERGVYRPGDDARISAFVRGVDFQVPDGMPVDVVVKRPDGRILLRQSVRCDENARVLNSASIPMAAPSGYYQVQLTLPGSKEVLGASGFRVADYIPPTLRMRLEAPEGTLAATSPVEVIARVEHLFGDPARGLKAKARARFSGAAFEPRGWDGVIFGDSRKQNDDRIRQLPVQTLDENGKAVFKLTAPTLATSGVIRMRAEVEVQEEGGRALSESIERTLHPHAFYLGLKPPQETIRPQEICAFDLMALTPDAKLVGQPVAWKASLYAVTYSNVLRRTRNGRLHYDWQRKEVLERAWDGQLDGGGTQLQCAPKRPGPYRLVVEAAGGCAVVHDLYVTGSGGGWMMHEPDVLPMTLDKASYRPDETAVCTVQAPFAGTALLCIERETVLEQKVVSLKEGKNLLPVKVRKGWQPNVFVTATLIRPVQEEEDWRAHRASGTVRLQMDCTKRKLSVHLGTPASARPAAPLEVRMRVQAEDGSPVTDAAVVFAAVDEGVLSLTRFSALSPFDYFYAQRRLDIREADLYDRLAPELSRWRATAKPDPGGGADEETPTQALARQLSPVQAKRVKTAVLYAGTLTTDAKGVATARFDVPEYIGELRCMAYVARGERFGVAQKALPVRSPLMVRSSWPRFVAPGDVFEVPLTVFNRTGADGDVGLSLELDKHLALDTPLLSSVRVAAGAEMTLHARVRAVSIGKTVARLQAQMGDETYRETLEMAVRPPVGFARQSGVLVVEPGKTKELRLPGGYLPSTHKAHVTVSGNPLVDVSGALHDLLVYPYGCLEQTTSRLIPLVYAQDLASLLQPETMGAEEVEALFDAGMLRLRMMQTYNGGFSWWPGGREPYEWGSLYVADLLVEARKAGFMVPDSLYDHALSYVERHMEQWVTNKNTDGSPRCMLEAAYGCYVLTRAGHRPTVWLARLEELVQLADADHFGAWTPPVTARCHLASAYLAAGEVTMAARFLESLPQMGASREHGGTLSSPMREAAILLLTLLDVKPDSPRIPALVRQLQARVRSGYWGTTQENAYALMTLGKYARRIPVDRDGVAQVLLAGGKAQAVLLATGKTFANLSPEGTVTIQAPESGKVYAFWHVEGVPQNGVAEEKDAGISIRRTLLDMDGNPVGAAAVKQGGLYRVSLQINTEHAMENVVIADLLPAGLEIENQNLRGTATVMENGHSVQYQRISPMHAEPRDDRLIVFANLSSGVSTYRYIVRAVSVGAFVWPAAEVSCMYDPSCFSVHGRTQIRIGR